MSIIHTPKHHAKAVYFRLEGDRFARNREIVINGLPQLERIKTASPAFFERLAIELLVKMGYGGSLVDAGMAIGKRLFEKFYLLRS